jgi:hypothetical protein
MRHPNPVQPRSPFHEHFHAFASVPIFCAHAEQHARLAGQGEQAHAEARKFDTANYLGLRLAPDMLPFTRQIQIVTDGAKGCVARLSGVEVPKWDDNEATLDELRARIRKALDYVQSFQAAQIDGNEDARDPAAHAPGRPAALHRRGLS